MVDQFLIYLTLFPGLKNIGLLNMNIVISCCLMLSIYNEMSIAAGIYKWESS